MYGRAGCTPGLDTDSNGKRVSERAVEQQTRDTPIEAERGVIYDTNKQQLAESVTCYSIWARPTDIKSGETKKESEANIDKAASSSCPDPGNG